MTDKIDTSPEESCVRCKQDIYYGCNCTEGERLEAESKALSARIAELEAKLATDGNTQAIAKYLDDLEDWDALQEVTTELEQAEAKIVELEAKLAKADRALDISCVIIEKLMEDKGDE